MWYGLIGIVGAGSMGRGIAQLAATAGHQVVIFDMSEENIMEARDYIRISLDKLVAKNKMDEMQATSIFGRLYFASSLTAMESCDLVIEAIVEKLDAKKQLFHTLENICSAETVFASNTSSLSISSIASAVKESSRVIGLHFFNPATIMPLVEIIPAIQTRPKLAAEMSALMSNWGKIPVLAKDTPGFIVNRIARPYYSEALRICEEGIADPATIDYAMTQLGGFRMGPFSLMDFIGHDVNFAVTCSVYEAFYHEPRYKPSFLQQRLVEAGFLGRKTSKGFYNYDSDEAVPAPSTDENLHRQLFDRILTMLINEAADALYYGIASAEDIDIAMTKGVNYPKGLLKWADEIGIEQIIIKMDTLFEFYHDPRYRCSPILRKMRREGKRFFGKEK
jgi:3-hydroxybutyryl-CoA dehydrogenase